MSALLLIFKPLGCGAAVIIPPVEPSVIPVAKTAFEALTNEFNIPEVRFLQTWFLPEKAVFPTCSLQRLSRTVYGQESCGIRIDQAVYRFNVYSLFKDQLHTILTRIEDKYDFSLPIYDSLNGRTHNCLHWDGRLETEVEPGLWYGYVDYLIYSERERRNNQEIIDADTLEEAIYKKYDLEPIFNLSWAQEKRKYPYLSIPSFQHILRGGTSCSRLETVQFSFELFCRSLDELEDFNEKLINLYDYASFNLTEKRFTTIEYISDDLLEVEPGIWKSTINWAAVLEKDIV